MAHPASKRFSYPTQLGILIALCGAGFIIGAIAGIIPLLSKINIADVMGQKKGAGLLEALMVPANANLFRVVQFITTLFAFALPAFFYAKICHKQPLKHLGFQRSIDIRQGILVIIIMLAVLPAVGALQELTEMLPWSKATLQQFKDAEIDYNKQVAVIGRMNNFADYILSLIMIALLPAVFEEILFRGALQNLLSRWTKMPVVAIVITAIIFSAIHGSYLGFLSRFALGFVLGWVYYRTGNIWLTIIAHFFNNGAAITALYVMSKPGKPMDPSAIDTPVPLIFGALAVVAVVGLFIMFEKTIKEDDYPGEETAIANEEEDVYASFMSN